MPLQTKPANETSTSGFPSIFKSAKRIVLPLIVGILMNIVYSFIFLGGWLNGATLGSTAFAILIFVAFLVGFPILYLLFTRWYAVREGVSFLYQSSNPLVSSAVDFMVSSIVLGEEVEDKEGFVGDTAKAAKDYMKQLNQNLPGPMKKAMTYVLGKIPIYDIINETKQEMDFNKENLSFVQMSVREKVDRHLKKEVVGNSSIWIWVLFIFNIACIVFAWMFAT